MYSIATGAQEIRQTSAQQESSATYDLVRSDKLNQHFWTLEKSIFPLNITKSI